ncbi:LysR family transcriptional regulator [Nocardia pseudovaccinii]|uniref:LysR family transcriptional regulator n=1 Tax=Nocardia pseudovaccinii TaxID=189540 RepID=UPI003D8A1C63
MDIELRHLRAFAAVAQRRSFTHAAEALFITQPALSRTVAQLETLLQVQLLDRSSRHVELTSAGREFQQHAERALAAVEQAVAVARQHLRVRLGFSWLLPDPWAQRTIAEFEQATEAEVTLVRCDNPQVAVTQGSVDIAVVRGKVTARGAHTVHLFDEMRVAACSTRSPLAGRERLEWTELADWPLVVNIVSGTTGPTSWAREHRPRTVVETTNYDEWLETVAADRGIGVVPETAARRSNHPAVQFLPLSGAPTVPVYLVFLPTAATALLRQFIETGVAAARR